MPPTELLVFREANGRIPMQDWLDLLPSKAAQSASPTCASIQRAIRRRNLVLAEPARYACSLAAKEV